jgi:hypothetical protein
MELKDILSITGQPGLYKYIAQSKTGMIVESIENQKRMNAYASQKISSLEDIAIFTNEKEMPLAEVLKKMYEKETGKAAIDHKAAPKDLEKYFAELIPDYDRDRVYASHIKKIVSWYNLLVQYKIMSPALWEEKKEEKAGKKEGTEEHEKHFEGVKEQKIPGKKEMVKKTKEPMQRKAASAGKSGGKLKNVGVKKT